MIASSLKGDSLPLVSLLLSRGANANAVTTSGQTALHFCVSKNNLDVARK